MASVTQRIKMIKQPHGGYLKPSEFKKIQYNDNYVLLEENIHSSLVGLTVDYMTRFLLGSPKEKAFGISLRGAKIINEYNNAIKLLSHITGLNNESVYYACKIVGYDVCFRAGIRGYKPVSEIEADNNTIQNIIVMINRSISFFNLFGPIIAEGITFLGGYTKIIDSGDGDFLTDNTLWDFKVSSNPPTSSNTLQLLVYYLLGKHSIHHEFNNIEKLGIFNPRLNCVFLKNICDIPSETIELVSKDVIGYGTDDETEPFTDTLINNDKSMYQSSENEQLIKEVAQISVLVLLVIFVVVLLIISFFR